MDWLMETALEAIEKEKPEMASWLADKRSENAKATRLDALRFICSSLDNGNKTIVCKALGVSPEDMEATRRVLRAI